MKKINILSSLAVFGLLCAPLAGDSNLNNSNLNEPLAAVSNLNFLVPKYVASAGGVGLYSAALAIRGTTCGADEDVLAFDETLKLAFENPREYAAALPPRDILEKTVSQTREYLRFWAVKSISNFALFKAFEQEKIVAMDNFARYFETNFKFDGDEVAFFAARVANELEYLAAGSYAKPYALSPLAKAMQSKTMDEEEISAQILAAKPNVAQLSELLNIALLYGRTRSLATSLIELGADLNSGDENALFFALKDVEMAKYLISRGANVNYANSFGKTPLFYAVQFGDTHLVNMLLEHGANANASYISQSLKDAKASGFDELPFYQNLCALERTGRTVLMHAAMHANPQILDLLIKAGANPEARDEAGLSASDYAQMAGKKENIEYLQKIGSNLK